MIRSNDDMKTKANYKNKKKETKMSGSFEIKCSWNRVISDK